MTLLILFAALAGAATALTPCVLPVLPALLSASVTGGRRRPLGVVLGLTVSHTLVIVALGSLVSRIGLADGFVRTFAILVLLFFGLSLILPSLGDRIEAPLSRLSRFGPRSAGSGFWSGIGVGVALGFVYAPCAGPIVAAIISVGATQDSSLELVAVAIAYGAGSALTLGLMAFGGRRVLERLRRTGRGPGLQRALGAVMVVTALAMFANLDVRFTTALANDFPAFLTNPTRGLERSDAVEERLAALRGSRASTPIASRQSRPVRTPPILRRATRCSATRRTSRTTRNGSTPLVGRGSRSRTCAGGWCSWTSGPTPASTASAPSPR